MKWFLNVFFSFSLFIKKRNETYIQLFLYCLFNYLFSSLIIIMLILRSILYFWLNALDSFFLQKIWKCLSSNFSYLICFYLLSELHFQLVSQKKSVSLSWTQPMIILLCNERTANAYVTECFSLFHEFLIWIIFVLRERKQFVFFYLK